MTPAENNILDIPAVQQERWKTARGFPFKTLAEMAVESVAKRWLIKSILARGETSAWIAPPGAMKSALMAQASICVAAGLDWNGYRSKERAGVVYFAHERPDLVRRRMMAICEKLQIEFPPVAIVRENFALAKPGDHRRLVQTIKEAEDCFGLPVGLGAFDTFAKLMAAGAGDENSAQHQGAVFSNLTAAKNETDIHIALVGHTGKDVQRGARGSNAFLGDVDLMVEIDSAGEVRTARVSKANDGPEGPLFSFESEIRNAGVDDDGDPITINIAGDAKPFEPATVSTQPKLKPNEKTAFAMLHDAGQAGLLQADWNTQLKDAGIGVKRPADLNDIRSSLKTKGLVRQYSDRWTVAN